MTHAESIALVADYLRSKDDIAGYINDEIGIAQIGRYHGEDRVEALELLDTAEAMNFAAIGEQIVNKLVKAYLARAEESRDDCETLAEKRFYWAKPPGVSIESWEAGIPERGPI